MKFICQSKIDKMPHIDGKADIIRLEILYKYGGIFIDADSVCVEPLDEDMFLDGIGVETDSGYDGFAVFENETCRKGLVSNAMMGFVPRHPLCRDIMLNILNDPTTNANMETTKAWFSVGPALLTRLLETGNYPSVFKYPSHIFCPHHFTGDKYRGHKKVFGHHVWGTTNLSYDTMKGVVLPSDLVCPDPPTKKAASLSTPSTPSFVEGEWHSVLVCSYNTERRYVRECLDSIANQIGHFGIELVWVNDGSNEQSTAELEFELERFRRTTRFTKVKYEKVERNMGVAMVDSLGVFLCSHPLIFRIDSDDMMVPYRMLHQLIYMKSHPDVKMLSAGMRMFEDGSDGRRFRDVVHPTVTISEFLASPCAWFWNHSASCYYKDTILELGNYNKKIYHRTSYSDFALTLRYLKKYGVVYNMPEVLVYYRIHPKQTQNERIAGANSVGDDRIFRNGMTENDEMKTTESEYASKIILDILGESK
jgi:glycosyltransferase involved in cell wall biosynthesis